jgi:hypothetical protein
MHDINKYNKIGKELIKTAHNSGGKGLGPAETPYGADNNTVANAAASIQTDS